MAVKSGFFNSFNHDRMYDAEDMNEFFDGVITEGVFKTIGDTFLVGPSSGLQIVVGSGKAWFRKTWLVNTSNLFLTLDTPDITYDRIDIIALDFDKSSLTRENDIVIVTGTPAGTPTPPTLVDTSDHLQKPLAHILVEANATVIGNGEITNKVGTVDCPYSAGLTDLIVDVDDVTIEINANEISVKDDGITDQQIGLRGLKLPKRQGGHPTDWDEEGDNNYTPGNVIMQCGSKDGGDGIPAGGSHTYTITFPQAFGEPPIAMFSLQSLGDLRLISWRKNATSTTQFDVTVENLEDITAYLMGIHWIAVGTE